MPDAGEVPAVTVSVVIPVYSGAATLPALIDELARLHDGTVSPCGLPYRVAEVVLVWDRGPGGSDEAMRELSAKHDWIRPVWLSRNFGQHAATLAGMSSAAGEWIVTMDEDGQHDPAYIGAMLDRAYETSSQLVYASPTNPPPHGAVRNMGSRFAKWSFRILVGDTDLDSFHSYRLILGEVGRSAAAYTGSGVYLDVALSWVIADSTTCPMPMRSEGRPASNYSFGRLLSHFGRLVISSGTRPLAMVSLVGLSFLAIGVIFSLWVLFARLLGQETPAGWSIHVRLNSHRRGPHALLAGRHRSIHSGCHEHVPREAPVRGGAGPGRGVPRGQAACIWAPGPLLMLVWVVGQGGLLGSSVVEALRAAHTGIFPGSNVPWESPAMAELALCEDLALFVAQTSTHQNWAIAWCAGSAVVASSAEQAQAELNLLDAFLANLSASLPATPGVFFLASSAGGAYAASADPPFDAETVPNPVSPYGRLKLRQERAVVTRLEHSVSVVIGRLSNLYGPRTDPSKGKGLIPLLCRAALFREPLNLYVPMDTIRDYLYAEDAGRLVVEAILDAAEARPPVTRVEVLASGESTTVAQLVATIQAIGHRRVPLALGTHPSARHQTVDLRMTPSRRPQGMGGGLTPLPTGVKRVMDTVVAKARVADMRVLLLGGTGFIGRSLARTLRASGVDVATLSRSAEADIPMDATDFEALVRLLRRDPYDVVVNLLGVGLATARVDDTTLHAVNAAAPAIALEALMDSGHPTAFVHAASSTERRWVTESDESDYSRAKYEGAQALRVLAARSSIPVSLVRVHNTYGPGQPTSRFIATTAATLKAGFPVTLNHPARVRDFVFVDDVVAALSIAVTDNGTWVAEAEVGTGVGTSLSDAARAIARCLGRPESLVRSVTPPLVDPHPFAVATTPGGTFGTCTTSLERGLAQTIGE